MDTRAMVWSWELTPSQFFADHVTIPIPSAAHIEGARYPFAGLWHEIEHDGARYQCQVALGRKSRSNVILDRLQSHPEISDSGDRRSGVILRSGRSIVASHIWPGVSQGNRRNTLWVDPAWRGRHLSTLVVMLWYTHVRRVLQGEPYPVTMPSLRASVAAHAWCVRLAVERGEPVPGSVADAVRHGVEAAEVLDRGAAAVAADGSQKNRR